ncbi:MAG: DNA translocase FtsK [Lachnospiraceae bacterium]|nr:DNA translocase FtsK [Lachnospiraceae bacterium]
MSHNVIHKGMDCFVLTLKDISNRGKSNNGILSDFVVTHIGNVIGIPATILLQIVIMVVIVFVLFGEKIMAFLRENNEYEEKIHEKEKELIDDEEEDYVPASYAPKMKRKLQVLNIDSDGDNNRRRTSKNGRRVSSSNASRREERSNRRPERRDANPNRKPVFEEELENKFHGSNADGIKIRGLNTDSDDASGMREITDGDSKRRGRRTKASAAGAAATAATAASAASKRNAAAPIASGDTVDLSQDKKTVRRKRRPANPEGYDAKAEEDKFTENISSSLNSKKNGKYVFPPVDFLNLPSGSGSSFSEDEIRKTAVNLEQTFQRFGVDVKLSDVTCGPTVTRFELIPAPGVRVNKITSLTDDIKLSLAVNSIRIEAPIPGKSAVGIEIPNENRSTVYFRELIESREFKKAPSKVTFAVGKDIYGKVIVSDIAKMPHLLIAGATGSGKSVCINTLIMSIIYKASPDEVKLLMIDPKMVELNVYNGLPHLFHPVVTDPNEAAAALNWACSEMKKRYELFAKLGVRNIKGYNQKIKKEPNAKEMGYEKMFYLVVIVDEFADLMMVASKDVENAVCRLAQLARAAGIHLVLATQRPSVNVITGVIKANIPSRVAFSVSSAIDSRTILDTTGAERLIGNGDMLFAPEGNPEPVRLQGSFVSDEEIEAVVDFLKDNNEKPVYDDSITKAAPVADNNSNGQGNNKSGSDRDEYFNDAAIFCIESERASAGQLQRRFQIGFNRAGRILDQLCEAGIVGPSKGTKPRQILVTRDELNEMLGIEDDVDSSEDISEDYDD